MMKVLAIYLPQYHRVKENDEWWGEGFTEWTAVKDAECYFEGQVQPRVPLHNNYYDLMKKETMEWQTNLMHQYGIDGMVFYHYWFKNGRKILEKPAENLLKWKDIDMPFCFDWANVSWTRTWSKAYGTNSWFAKQDGKMQIDEENALLLDQQYGDEDDWKVHFEYLNLFFEDKRYIRIENKPVIIIHKPELIASLERMMWAWRKWAKENGHEDLFIIGTCSEKWEVFDANYLCEPANGTREINKIGDVIDSQEIWNHIIYDKIDSSKKTYLCGFVGYDNTPRMGRAGTVLSTLSSGEFEDNLTKLFAKSKALDNELVFINAWNEWGESNYLEPDELFGYGNLEAVRNAIIRSECEPFDLSECYQSVGNSNMSDRYLSYWKTMDRWMILLESGKTIEQYLHDKGIQHIAIYGLGLLGKHLLTQLSNTDIVIDYAIDRKGAMRIGNFPVITLEEDLPETQLIVVTVTYDFAKIYKEILSKTSDKVIGLDELIENIINNDK